MMICCLVIEFVWVYVVDLVGFAGWLGCLRTCFDACGVLCVCVIADWFVC